MLRVFVLTFLLGVSLFAGIAWLGYKSGGGPAATGETQPASSSDQSTAWSEPDNFMGWRFGENLRTQLSTCPADRGSSRTPCIEDIVKDTFEIKNLYVGDQPLGVVYARQISNRLHQITVVFPSNRYSEVSDIFVERYGKPTMRRTEMRKFKSGASVSSDVLEWLGKNINITVQERGEKADEGLAVYSTATWRAAKEAENKRQVQDAAKRL